jgi:acetyl-CoA carboxylase biotin carboxyl carrier protein
MIVMAQPPAVFLPRTGTPPGSFRLAQDNLTYDDLLRIVELIKASEQFSEFRLKIGEIEVELRRRGAADQPGTTVSPLSSSVPSSDVLRAAPETSSLAPGNAVPPPLDEPSWPEGSLIIRSPMVGTFYRASEPGAEPFVEVGQVVDSDTIVCIIEVMKLMNSIPAGRRGTVMQILVADAAPIENGQPLIVLRPESV